MHQNTSKCIKHQTRSPRDAIWREIHEDQAKSSSAALPCSGSGWVQGDHDQPRYQATPILLALLASIMSIRNQDCLKLSRHLNSMNSDFAQDVAGCTRASNSRPRCSLEALGWWGCRTNGWLSVFNLVPWICLMACSRVFGILHTWIL